MARKQREGLNVGRCAFDQHGIERPAREGAEDEKIAGHEGQRLQRVKIALADDDHHADDGHDEAHDLPPGDGIAQDQPGKRHRDRGLHRVEQAGIDRGRGVQPGIEESLTGGRLGDAEKQDQLPVAQHLRQLLAEFAKNKRRDQDHHCHQSPEHEAHRGDVRVDRAPQRRVSRKAQHGDSDKDVGGPRMLRGKFGKTAELGRLGRCFIGHGGLGCAAWPSSEIGHRVVL